MEQKKVSLGITAYNEERAIPRLIKSIFSQKIPEGYALSEIIFVTSGCTDNTNPLIRSYQERDDRIILIEEKEKNGKPAALNKIIRSFKGDILILSGADGYFNNDSLYWLLKNFDDASTSAACGHPVPINPKNSLWGYGSYMLWEFHHLVLSHYPEKLSGELCALKREFLEIVPENKGGDDIYLERSVMAKNGKISYEQRAIIHILGPQTIVDYFKQRRRVMGHIKKAEIISNIQSPTTTFSKLVKIMLRNIRKFLSPYSIPVMIVELLARFMASRDVRKERITSNWEVISTTKDF
ncbi:MAG: glycosyltransferase [Promethearchaeota archaeon]